MMPGGRHGKGLAGFLHVGGDRLYLPTDRTMAQALLQEFAIQPGGPNWKVLDMEVNTFAASMSQLVVHDTHARSYHSPD